MSTEVSIYSRVRKMLEGWSFSGQDTEQQLVVNNQLELLIAQSAVPYQEIVRSGRVVKIGTTSPVPAIVAMPTTAVALGVYNGEPDNGKTFIVDWIGAVNAVSTAVVAQAQMLALVGQVREVAPADAALPIVKMNGMGSAVDANIRTILTATPLPANTGLAANWFPMGPSITKPSAVATPGYGLWSDVSGRFMIPPGRYGAIHVMANVVGETFNVFMVGHMKQIELG